MRAIIWADILGFTASALLAVASFRKKRNDILKVQIVVCILNLISNFLLGVYSAMTTGAISTVCTALNSKGKLSKRLAYIMAAVVAAVGLAVNMKGLPGLLPPLASVEFLILSQRAKTAQGIRLTNLINLVIWIIYEVHFQLYSVALVDAVIAATVIFNLVKYRAEKNDDVESLP